MPAPFTFDALARRTVIVLVALCCLQGGAALAADAPGATPKPAFLPPIGKLSEMAVERPADRHADRSTDRGTERAGAKTVADKAAIEQLAVDSKDRPTRRVARKAADRPLEAAKAKGVALAEGADTLAAHGARASAAGAETAPRGRAALASVRGARESTPDPMDKLRELLAERLGAADGPKAGANVMRIATNSPSEAPSPRSARRPAAHATAPNPALLAAAHRRGEAVGAADVERPRGTASASSHAGAGHWGYQGAHGPEHWGRMKPEYASCDSGPRQSPIDIRDGIKVQLDPVQFDYKPSGFSVLDNGHTVQINVDAGNAIEVMGRRYELVQFHFHLPAEERVNGRGFAMVAHLVHKSADGRPAVVAVLLDRGAANPIVQSVWNNLPLEKGEALRARPQLDLNMLLPAERGYYTYMGSLTTPPCSEGVLWMVMKQPMGVSTEQIGIFARLYPMNARPVQSASGRLIKESN